MTMIERAEQFAAAHAANMARLAQIQERAAEQHAANMAKLDAVISDLNDLMARRTA